MLNLDELGSGTVANSHENSCWYKILSVEALLPILMKSAVGVNFISRGTLTNSHEISCLCKIISVEALLPTHRKSAVGVKSY